MVLGGGGGRLRPIWGQNEMPRSWCYGSKVELLPGIAAAKNKRGGGGGGGRGGIEGPFWVRMRCHGPCVMVLGHKTCSLGLLPLTTGGREEVVGWGGGGGCGPFSVRMIIMPWC